MSELRVGTSKSSITPAVGGLLTGFGARVHGSTGVHDELLAQALVFDDGDTMAAIVTADLLGLTDETVAEIRRRIVDAAGIPSENVMVNCSHTHSGPACMYLRGIPVDEGYVNNLVCDITGCVLAASKQLQPARLSVGTGKVTIGYNRRRPAEHPESDADPRYPIDDEVTVLSVQSDTGSGTSLLAYSAHPVVLGGTSYLVSTDYVGPARVETERILGGTAMFFQGGAGNINVLRGDGSVEYARSIGVLLAAEATKASVRAQPVAATPIRATSVPCVLPLASLPSTGDARQLVVRLEALLAEARE